MWPKNRENFLSASYYRSDKGVEFINKEKVEKVLTEKAYTTRRPEHLSDPINNMTIEWGFYIGIYKCTNSIYLILSANISNESICEIQQSYERVNEGIIRIDSDTCDLLLKKLDKLGKEYFENKTENFNLIINAILSIIPNDIDVKFGVMFNHNGYYCKTNEEIGINLAQSQYVILKTLIHEYVHYLTKNERFKKYFTIRDYITNEAEFICNQISSNVIKHFCKNLFLKNVLLPLLKSLINNKDAIITANKDEIDIIKELNSNAINHEKIIQNITDNIISDLSESIRNMNEEKYRFQLKQSQLVILNEKDNLSLLHLIFDDISPLIPQQHTIEEIILNDIQQKYLKNLKCKMIAESVYYTENHYVNISGFNFNKWLFYVGIYESNDINYLILECNIDNREYDSLLDYLYLNEEESIILKEGCAEITSEIKKDIVSELNILNPDSELKPLNKESNQLLYNLIITKINPILPDYEDE